MSNSYPPVGFYFSVAFNGGGLKGETSFKEVSGLNVDMSPEEITEGGQLAYHHRLPTVPKYTNLVLKRGLLINSKLRTWMEKGINEFEFTPITVVVKLLNQDAKPMMSWIFYKVWPIKWEVSGFNAMNNELVVESMELGFSHFKTKSS